jgi:hypothetical protein
MVRQSSKKLYWHHYRIEPVTCTNDQCLSPLPDIGPLPDAAADGCPHPASPAGTEAAPHGNRQSLLRASRERLLSGWSEGASLMAAARWTWDRPSAVLPLFPLGSASCPQSQDRDPLSLRACV